MKKVNPLAAFLLLIILFSACGKKDGQVSTVENAPVNSSPSHFIKYKLDGVQITCDSLSAMRDTATSPNPHRIVITGSASASPFLPKVEIMIEEQNTGWVQGLTVTCNSASNSYVFVKDASAVIYNSLFSPTGVNLFFSHLTYNPNSSLSGTFSGSIKNVGSTTKSITEGSFSLVFAN